MTAWERADGSGMFSSNPPGAAHASTAAWMMPARTAWRAQTASRPSSSSMASASRNPYRWEIGGVPQ